jgi:hypothetical protein
VTNPSENIVPVERRTESNIRIEWFDLCASGQTSPSAAFDRSVGLLLNYCKFCKSCAVELAGVDGASRGAARDGVTAQGCTGSGAAFPIAFMR